MYDQIENTADPEESGKDDIERVRAWAFRLILETGQPASMSGIQAASRLKSDALHAAIEQLEYDGRIRRNEAGDIIGSAGLTIEPTRHRIEIEDRIFWTWCAYDATGILAALGTDGRIVSHCPATSNPIEVRFTLGHPAPSPTVLFIAEKLQGGSLVADWCPKNNFFLNAETAALWVERQKLTGKIVDLDEAVQLTVERWQSCLRLSQRSCDE